MGNYIETIVDSSHLAASNLVETIPEIIPPELTYLLSFCVLRFYLAHLNQRSQDLRHKKEMV